MRIKSGMKNMKRRDFLRTVAGTAALAGITGPFDYLRAQVPNGEQGIQITNIYRTRPSGWGYSGGHVVRIETNKGITGYGECRDVDRQAQTWLETLAPQIVGMNPTKIEEVYNKLVGLWTPPPMEDMWDQEKRGTGAISGIEMACWDIVGKVYNVPVYQLLGPRLRDKIPMYADTDNNSVSGVESRIAKGFRHYKCDMYLSQIAVNSGWPRTNNYTVSSTKNNYGYNEITINQTGLDQMHAYMEQYRETLQSFGEPYASAPIGSDHYQGYDSKTDFQLSVESAIALSETMKDHNPNGYMEDIIDWWIDDCSGLPCKEVADATDMRQQNGEDMFGFDQLKVFADLNAFDNFHPEPNTFGGLNQTLMAAKYADSKGIRNYFHNSSGPIAMSAYAHLAAATPGFVALEYHNMGCSWHDSLIDGVVKPMIQDGYTFVPEGPGLGLTPNATAFAQHNAGTWTKIT